MQSIMRHMSVVLLLAAGFTQQGAASVQANPSAPPGFGARALLVLSDADQAAAAYTDGRLDAPRPGAADELTVITLDGRGGVTAASAVVSNSVYGPPTLLALAPDRRTAFVAETRGPPAQRPTTLDSLPVGRLLTVVDLANLHQPRVVQQQSVGENADAVGVDPTGALLVATNQAAGRPLAAVPLRDGRLGAPIYLALPHGADTAARVSHVAWHPSGRALAAVLPFRNEVMFLRVARHEAAGVRITPWGAPVPLGKFPFTGRFTPDGRHFVVTEMQWGTDVPGFWVEAPPGALSVIRLADVEREADVSHRVVARAETGKDPEGLAVSPDGRLVVTLNAESSYLREGDPRRTAYGTLSLFALDAETGSLTRVQQERVARVLQQGAAFDTAGRFLAVTAYEDASPDGSGAGAVDFWRVERAGDRTPTPRLVPLPHSVSVPRGAHALLVVP